LSEALGIDGWRGAFNNSAYLSLNALPNQTYTAQLIVVLCILTTLTVRVHVSFHLFASMSKPESFLGKHQSLPSSPLSPKSTRPFGLSRLGFASSTNSSSLSTSPSFFF